VSGDTSGDSGEEDADTVPQRLDDLDGPILLFDGVCNLCNAAVRFVIRFDAAARFQFAPLQSAVGQALLERHGLATADFDSVVLIEDGDYATKSTAALRVARQLDGPWPLLYPLIVLPERVRDRAYDVVADYRYRLFGRKDECPVPDPEIRERFADRRLD
jgi:predicted DCC family thiol-disulfide oxidoreductase YuxK